MTESIKLVAFSAALVTIVTQVGSQLVLRWQVADLGQLSPLQVIIKAVASPWVWIALGAMVLGMVTWLVTLSRLSLNQAYPLVALTIPLTAVISTYLFNEHLPALRSVGIGLIVVGVILVGRS